MAKTSSEKKKRMFLGILGGVFLVVLVYEVFLSGPTPRPTRNPQGGVATSTTPAVPTKPGTGTPQAKPTSAAAQQEAIVRELLSDVTPLNLSAIGKSARSPQPGGRGNIFGYYVPPPPPPAPPPPPPPIQVVGIQPQSAVAGTPRPFTLVITGNKIPADAQIFFDGAARATKRPGENQVSTEMLPGDYAYARNINVDVKSQGDPSHNFSNPITFVVQPGPEPQFTYKGRLGALNQPLYNYAVFELTSTREIKRGKVGDTIMGVWRIDAITETAVDVTHTQYEIKRRVPLQDKVR